VAAAHAAVTGSTGACTVCGRATATYAGRTEHRRGRIAGVSPYRLTAHRELRSLEEMLALGICDCGARLDDHPPLKQPKPLDYGRPCSRAGGSFSIGLHAPKEPKARPVNAVQPGHQRRGHLVVVDATGRCASCGRELRVYADGSVRHRRVPNRAQQLWGEGVPALKPAAA